jgi:hypothetical protein
VWYSVRTFWQCGIFRHDIGTVLTVWYFSTWFRNCSDSVVFFDMISELCWQCGINTTLSEQFKHHVRYTTLSEQFRNHIEKHVEKYYTLRTVPKSMFELFWQCSISYIISDSVVLPISFLNYSDSVVFFYMTSELLWQCCIFLHVFLTWFRNFSDSVVFFYMISEQQFRNHVEKHVEKYYTLRTVPKSYRKTCRKIQHC